MTVHVVIGAEDRNLLSFDLSPRPVGDLWSGHGRLVLSRDTDEGPAALIFAPRSATVS